MAALLHRGHEVLTPPGPAKQVRAGEFDGVDVLHVHRYCDRATRAMMQRAQEHGVAVVWDEDDDVVSFRGTQPYRHVSPVVWERRRAAIDRVLGIADLVTTPSAELAERFRERGATDVTVIENYVPKMFLRVQPPHVQSGVTIGWVAAIEHLHDASELHIRSVLQRILDERSDVRVTTIGVPLRLESDRYTHIPSVPLVESGPSVAHAGDPNAVKVSTMKPGLVRYIAEFDIAIAPLADAPYNVTRSNIKLKEYASVGKPWLASPIGPYAGMGEEQGGRLVADGDWHPALMRLIDKSRERKRLGKRARKWVVGETLESNAALWEDALTTAIARARTRRTGAARPPLSAARR